MMAKRSALHGLATVAHQVVTDLKVCIYPPVNPSPACTLTTQRWYRIEKELCSYMSQRTAWLYAAVVDERYLKAEDLLITDIKMSESPPFSDSDSQWESRSAGIWVLRGKYCGSIERYVTDVDVLFGIDAIDPRPQWLLMRTPLQLDTLPDVPVARLSVLHGTKKSKSGTRATLRAREDGKFRIVQVSDTHMVTGVGLCKDAIDAHGKILPETEADPRTVSFVGDVLDVERPDLVIFTGDQLHHDISDSQSALFKVVAPVIQRSLPYAAVFGNHDSEGSHALSRAAQMSILQNLPYSLCEPGPKNVDGTGNFYLQIFAPAPSEVPLATLYLLDSHGQIPSKTHDPDYEPIKQSQIDWSTSTSQALRKAREKRDSQNNHSHLCLVFQHIPLPEYGDPSLNIRIGHRGEPTEGPSCDSHFYDALLKEGVSAIGCGHDHVNDFCALLPPSTPTQRNNAEPFERGPWLCYAGGSGFGGYGSYAGVHYHRRMRVWELDTYVGSLTTWLRVEYADDRIDELKLIEGGSHH